jgi:DNA-binding NtrC family response regulator
MTTQERCDKAVAELIALTFDGHPTLYELERAVRAGVINAGLKRVGGNQCELARALCVHRNTLVRFITEMRKTGQLSAPTGQYRTRNRSRSVAATALGRKHAS